MTLESPGLLFTIVAFFLMIGPLVFVHELGHYLVGRWFGVDADSFSIGFGREILGWTDKRGTRWKVGWLQLGGYVKFAGDINPASQPSEEWLRLPPEQRARTFQAKPVWQRFLIVLAGPMINFLLAVVIFMVILASYGEWRTPPVVTGIMEESVAARAGFEIGDRVVAVDGESISSFEEMRERIFIRPETPMRFDVLRDGRALAIDAAPAAHVERDPFGNEMRIGLLGVEAEGTELMPVAPLALPGKAIGQTVRTVEMIVVTLGQIITGRRSVEELGGPLRIAEISGQQASLGVLAFALFMAAVSINLGFINLLPIPMLDGGHLVFYAVEAARRKPLSRETQEWAFRMGLAVLLGFMLMVTVIDLGSFGLWERLSGLIG
ncbi:MAG: RIP metalloprotease [Sphingomonadaceae bacterium]|nr:RIP metalloprotease [Sphingomonadaceae bacterium]